MLRWLSFTITASLLTATLHAAPPLYDDRFFEPVAEVVTPHITWAKPYLPGPPKILFITHRNAMREIIELRQRLEMDYELFAYDGADSFGETGIGVDASWRLIRGNSFAEQGERLREKLRQHYDVIVLGGIRWDAMPLDCRYEILKQVKAGTGLVGSVTGVDEYLGQITATTRFAWNWAMWTGEAQGIADFLGQGEFSGGVDYSGGHTGEAALRIVCTKAIMGSREAPRAGYHPGPIKLETGAEYVLSCWTRSQGLVEGGIVFSPYPQQPELHISASEDWKYSELRFRAEGENPTAGAYLLLYQPGTVWIDDVQLVKVGNDQNLLPNPSFENPGPTPEVLAEGLPWKSLPVFARQNDVQSFLRSSFQITHFGAGRIGLTAYGVPGHQMLTPGPTGRLQDCRLDYDYYLAAAVKLILWGARQEPPVRVTSTQPMITTERHALTENMPLFRLELPENMRTGTAKLVIRDRRGRVWHEEQAKLQPAGAQEIAPQGARLPRGEYFADLWVKSGNRIAGFGSVGLTVTGPVGLTELRLRASHVRQGETLAGTAVCDGLISGCRLRVTVTDYYQRQVAVREWPVTTASTAFAVPMPPMLSITGRVTAELLKGAEVLDARSEEFSVTNRYADRQDVQFVMWMDYPEDFIGPMMAEEFTRNGIDAQYGGNLGYAPYANQWWLPYSTRFTDAKTDWYQERPTREPGDLVRDPCLTDPIYREKTRAELTAKAKAGLDFSTSDFTLGDENMFVAGDWDLCFSDTCNADFRRWANETYGSLEALNASWGSDYTNWEQVKSRTLEECKADGNFVPWVDHRLHMESVWADIHAFSRDVIREIVPAARVGYEGSDTHVGSYYAADYWKLAQAMDLNNIYYRDFLTLAWKDFVTPETLLGAGWFGGYPNNRNEPFMRWFPWRALFKGSNSFWVWAGYGHPGAVMAYDVSLYPFFQSACEEIAEIEAGPGKLLMGSRRQHDGIALLWSPSSVHMATATPGFPAMDSTLQGLVQLLHDVGLEARVLSYEQVAQGQLTNTEFRVLLLPGAQALSDAEVAAIRRFAMNGGTILADLRPGVTNEHGKPRSGGALDDLFGIKQGPAFQQVDGDLKPTTDASLPLSDLTVLADGSVVVTTGKNLAQIGTAPAWILHDHTLLLNFPLHGYLSLAKSLDTDFAGWQEGAAYRQFMTDFMADHGVTPQVTVKPDAPQVEVSRFHQGQAEYVGIVQNLPRDPLLYTNKAIPLPQPRTVTIDFGRRTHLYDLRSGKYLGETSTLRTSLTPGLAQLYALLPYRVNTVNTWTSAKAQVGAPLDYAFRIQASATPEQHVLRLRVFGPEGKERAYYARNLRTGRGGRLEGTLHFAADDPAGTWKLVARDVATGVTGTVSVEVKR